VLSCPSEWLQERGAGLRAQAEAPSLQDVTPNRWCVRSAAAAAATHDGASFACAQSCCTQREASGAPASGAWADCGRCRITWASPGLSCDGIPSAIRDVSDRPPTDGGGAR
jgi:hypothetical protein